MLIRHVYIPILREYKSNRKLSESQVKKRLEKQGWEVWRGGNIGCLRRDDIYPNVRRKYEKLRAILGQDLDLMQYLCSVHHGMPDYFCFRKGEKKFVECKLGHEQLSNGQKACFEVLMRHGYNVEVHKLVFECTKLREADVDILSGAKVVREKQERLKLHYKRRK